LIKTKIEYKTKNKKAAEIKTREMEPKEIQNKIKKLKKTETENNLIP
jgi:hypothetical protein